jgi:hypothetical protein
MMTEHGKAVALAALASRRETYKDVKLPRNEDLTASAPMYFRCIGCGATITQSREITTQPKCCEECEALRYFGWME